MNRDVALGCLMLTVAGVYYSAATAIPASQLADAIGPQGLPKTYAVVLALLSFILIGQSVWRVRKDPPYDPQNPAHAPEPDSAHSPRVLWRFAGMLVIGVVYIALVRWVGYIVSLATLIMVTTYYQGGVINRRVAMVAVSGALFFWLLFVFVLGIPQPAGLWSSLF